VAGSEISVLPLHLGDFGESQFDHPSSSSLVGAGERLLPGSDLRFGVGRELST
jgi:hypothetical protein